MAGPTYGAAGTRLSGANDTSADIAAPAGVVANSVVVAFIARGGATSIAYETPTLPDGTWHLVPDNPGKTSDSSGGQLFDVAWHRASGSESGPYTFSWTTSAFRAGFAVRIDGCRTTGNPFEADDGAVGGGTTTPAVSVTTTGADRLLLFGGSSWSSGTWTAPSGYTTRVNDVSFDLLYAATIDQAVAGSSGSVTASQANWAHGAWLGAFPPSTASISGTAAAPLGTLTAAASGTPTVAASAAAVFGRLLGSATATPNVTATAAAALGRLVAAASGVPTVGAAAVAAFGGLTGAATVTPNWVGSAAAAFGSLHGAATTTRPPSRAVMRAATRRAATMSGVT